MNNFFLNKERLQEQATAQALQTATAKDGIQGNAGIDSVFAAVSLKKRLTGSQHDSRISRCQSPATSISIVKSSNRSKKRSK